jgi:hypothetical protein
MSKSSRRVREPVTTASDDSYDNDDSLAVSVQQSCNSYSGNKKRKTNSWSDITAVCKAVLKGVFNEMSGSLNIQVLYMDNNFLDTFGHQQEEDGISLSQLAGLATGERALKALQTAVYAGDTCTEYINLYRKCGTAISCHIAFQPLTKHGRRTVPPQPADHGDCSWGVLTVRSASAVGNAHCFGIGVFPHSHLSEDAKTDALSVLYVNK